MIVTSDDNNSGSVCSSELPERAPKPKYNKLGQLILTCHPRGRQYRNIGGSRKQQIQVASEDNNESSDDGEDDDEEESESAAGSD